MRAAPEAVKGLPATKLSELWCAEDLEVRVVAFGDRFGSVRIGHDSDVQDARTFARTERAAVRGAEIDFFVAPLIRGSVDAHRNLEKPALVAVDRCRLGRPAELESAPLGEERRFLHHD